MKKLVLGLLLVGFLVSFSPIVKADTVQPTQEELTQQLIVLLTNLIAQLQQQINDILAQQAVQNTALNNIQINTQQIAQNTVPTPTGETLPVAPTVIAPLPDLHATCTDLKVTATGGTGSYDYGWNTNCNALFHFDGTFDLQGPYCHTKYANFHDSKWDGFPDRVFVTSGEKTVYIFCY